MKPRLLVGQTGIGKTYMVEQYARDHNLHLVEYNASDTRTEESLKDLSALQTRAVTGRKIMYLFDEVDSLDKGGAKRLSEFLKQVEDKEIPVFLTANKKDKVSQLIKKVCDIEPMYPKTEEEIKDILINAFTDCLGYDITIFKEMVDNAAKNCHGDIRKAQQLLMYSNISHYEKEKLDTITAVKMILYEEDRRKVFDYIKLIPVSSLYSWLFETFAINRKKGILKDMQEGINESLYKINEEYIYSFIAFELPKQEKKLIVRLPTNPKFAKQEETIMVKIRESYKCSQKESMQYLNLIRSINQDKFCLNSIATKCGFSKGEREFLGLEEIKKIVKEKKTTASILQY